MQVTIPAELENFVRRKMESKGFSTPDEVVTAALHIIEDNERTLYELRQAIQEGIDSADAGPIDMNEFIEDLHGRYPEGQVEVKSA